MKNLLLILLLNTGLMSQNPLFAQNDKIEIDEVRYNALLEKKNKLPNQQMQLDSLKAQLVILINKEKETSTADKNQIKKDIEALKKDTAMLSEQKRTRQNEQQPLLEYVQKNAEQIQKTSTIPALLQALEDEKTKKDELSLYDTLTVQNLQKENEAYQDSIHLYTYELLPYHEKIQKLREQEKNNENALAQLTAESEQMQIEKEKIPALQEKLRTKAELHCRSQNYDLDMQTLIDNYADFRKEGQEGEALLNKLQLFKTLCQAIKEARNIINTPYNKESTNNAYQNLSLLKTDMYLPEQKQDIENYKKRLKEYCDNYKTTYLILESAHAYLPELEEKALSILNKALIDFPEIKEYPYLLKEIEKKKNNLYYQPQLSEVECNN